MVSFVGYCRDEGGRLAALELEHYPGMAEEEIARVAARGGSAVAAPRRDGDPSLPGGSRRASRSSCVAVAAAHRGEAFAAAEMLMDYLKTRAPFWKRAVRADGVVEGWVEAKGEDDASAARWGAAER